MGGWLMVYNWPTIWMTVDRPDSDRHFCQCVMFSYFKQNKLTPFACTIFSNDPIGVLLLDVSHSRVWIDAREQVALEIESYCFACGLMCKSCLLLGETWPSCGTAFSQPFGLWKVKREACSDAGRQMDRQAVFRGWFSVVHACCLPHPWNR